MGPRSEWMTGRTSLLATVSMAASNIVFTSSSSGRVPIDQLITRPSKQSMMGEFRPMQFYQLADSSKLFEASHGLSKSFMPNRLLNFAGSISVSLSL